MIDYETCLPGVTRFRDRQTGVIITRSEAEAKWGSRLYMFYEGAGHGYDLIGLEPLRGSENAQRPQS